MAEDTVTTISWADAGRRIVDLEVPRTVAEGMGRGEAVSWRSLAEPRRRPKDEALKEIGDQRAALLARKDQVEAERDALVDRYPELKSAPRFIPPDQAA
jgi:hypothetical protein